MAGRRVCGRTNPPASAVGVLSNGDPPLKEARSGGDGAAVPTHPWRNATVVVSSAPPVSSRSKREQAHRVLLARRLAGKSGTSPVGRTVAPAAGQLNVPGSTTIGVDAGDTMPPPPAPHGPHAGPQAGSCIGVPQAGWQGGAQGWAAGAAQGAAPPAQGERNSMNEGRRQLFEPPKQLLQPGAAARLPRAITRHRERHMVGISTTVESGTTRGRTRCVVRDDAFKP